MSGSWYVLCGERCWIKLYNSFFKETVQPSANLSRQVSSGVTKYRTKDQKLETDNEYWAYGILTISDLKVF